MESLTIELRPQLRSGYVYVLLQPDTHVDSVRIIQEGDSMTAKINNKELTLNLSPIEINSSVTSLQFLNQWIVFRIQLNQSTLNDSDDLASNKKSESLGTKINLPPAQKSLKLTCVCDYSITKEEVAFERVLSLPSEECEPSEWFCCSHSDLDYKNILCPRTYDCFYGSHFYVLNTEILTSELVTSDKDVICNRCLSVLGITKNDGSYKIWSHCVQFTSIGDTAATSEVQEKSPLADFKLALEEFMKNGNLFQEVCYCAAEQGKKMSLCVKIMDKNLPILTQSSVESSSKVTLKKRCVIKVLYKYSDNGLENPKGDSNRSAYRISMPSILAAVGHLTASSLRLPPIYRSTDSYWIGYIS